MNINDYIEINPAVMVGKPVIKNTRIPVTLILNLMAHDYTIDRIIQAYPLLTKPQIQAAIEYSEQRLSREEVHPLIKPAIA